MMTYHENMTPSDYNPEFFTPQTAQNHYHFPANKKVLRIKVGQLSSDHHAMSLRFAHVDDSMFEDTQSVNETSSAANTVFRGSSVNGDNDIVAEEKRDQLYSQ